MTEGPRLVLPPNWRVDATTEERLLRQLSRAPADIAAIAAEATDLPPGSSYRVHAERLALQPLTATTERVRAESEQSLRVHGAVLLRPDVEYSVDDDGVDVFASSLLVDHGTHAHNPWRPIPKVRPATVLGRPPFRRRPVVVFLTTHADRENEDWARSLVNGLLSYEVEGRMAIAHASPGEHLTMPCAPSRESIEALAPDVIVAVDDTELAHATEWAPLRTTTVIQATADIAREPELLSWRLGKNTGRVRARIGRRIQPRDLAQLVNRLCAGPHPMPPAFIEQAAATEEVTDARPAITAPITYPATAIVVEAADAVSRRRLDAFADQAVAVGATCTVTPLAEATATTRQTDLLVLHGVRHADRVLDLVRERRAHGLRTIIDVDPRDVRVEDASVSLAAEAVALLQACGWATTPSRLVHAELTRLGVRAQLVPTLVGRSAFDDWRTTRIRRATVDMIGWHVGDGGDRDRSELEPAAQALTTALRNHLELRIDLTGDPNRMPELLLHHRRVRVIVGPPSRSDVARWDLQLWTPDHVRCEVAGYLEPVVVAGAAGVPTAAGAASGAARDALLSAATTVPNTASANSWSRVIEHFLGDARQLRRESATVSRRVESLFGAAAASTVLNRFFGWATNGAEA